MSSTHLSVADVLALLARDDVHFLRLQFIDLEGTNKNVEVPKSQFEKALNSQIMFDGSSIEGFVRIEESDMLLKPDLDTYIAFPWEEHRAGKVARLICDIVLPDGSPFGGCTRSVLKRQIDRAASLGYSLNVGPEAEFFLFEVNGQGQPTTQTHDAGGYFDLTPVDRGEACRRDIVETLEVMGFEIEAAHHEVAPGQHEIDFKYADAMTTADRLATFKMVVRKIAADHALHATFMPKPVFGINGSGMHCHQSLFHLDPSQAKPGADGNAFYDPDGEYGMSTMMRHYLGGLLEHAPAFAAITNPLVNSFKRLVPGYEAPVNVAWSQRNRSPLARIPDRRGAGTRVELRMPDPSCNPYLAFAVMLAAGLDGMANQTDPGEPVNENIFAMSEEEKASRGIRKLPRNLSHALHFLEQDETMQAALGEHVVANFLRMKKQEWQDYISTVHDWEIDRYLAKF